MHPKLRMVNASFSFVRIGPRAFLARGDACFSCRLVDWVTGSSVEVLFALLGIEHSFVLVAPVNNAHRSGAGSSDDQHLHGTGRFPARGMAFDVPATGGVLVFHAAFSVSPTAVLAVKECASSSSSRMFNNLVHISSPSSSW
jgi:hypothetical protein